MFFGLITGAAMHITLFAANVLGMSFAAAYGVGLLAVGAGLTALGALATGALSSQQPAMRTPQAQAVVNQATGPRVRGYGKALLGGTRAFWDSKSGDLHQVIMMHSGEIDAIEHIRVGDIVASLNGSGDATNGALSWDGNRAVRIRQHLGLANQSADSLMTGAWSGVWTAEHRLRGIAYLVARFRSPPAEDYNKIFPEGAHTPVRALCRLTKIWDPRTDMVAWSDNAALCILDYLTHPDGYRRSIDDIDIQSFIDFANVCDENVPLAGGGSEKRYRLWGVYSLNDEPQSVLSKMRAACDAELYQTAEGKIAIRGGTWTTPTVTIEPEHILGHTMDQGNNRFSAFNELKIMYTSPQHDFQTMEAQAWIDLADQAERGPIPSDLDLDFVPSPSQARRLAKIHIAKSNPRWKGRVVVNLTGLNALGERAVRIIMPELQIDDAFFISGFNIRPDLTAVELEVISIAQAAYDWTTAEEGENPAIPQETTPDLEFPVPQNLTLTEPEEGAVLATVDDPGRDGLTLQVQIRAGSGANWLAMETQPDGLTALITGLPPGEYQAQARWLGPQNTAGAWSFPYAEIELT